MQNADIVPVGTALDVIFRLPPAGREAMAKCLREELDPPINASLVLMLEGIECHATLLSNGWTAVYREDLTRDLFHLLGTKKIVVYDLLNPESAISSGIGLRIS